MRYNVTVACPACEDGEWDFRVYRDPGDRETPPDTGADVWEQSCDCIIGGTDYDMLVDDALAAPAPALGDYTDEDRDQ